MISGPGRKNWQEQNSRWELSTTYGGIQREATANNVPNSTKQWQAPLDGATLNALSWCAFVLPLGVGSPRQCRLERLVMVQVHGVGISFHRPPLGISSPRRHRLKRLGMACTWGLAFLSVATVLFPPLCHPILLMVAPLPSPMWRFSPLPQSQPHIYLIVACHPGLCLISPSAIPLLPLPAVKVDY